MKIKYIQAIIYIGLIIYFLILSSQFLPLEEPSGCTTNYSVYDLFIPVFYLVIITLLFWRTTKCLLEPDDKDEKDNIIRKK